MQSPFQGVGSPFGLNIGANPFLAPPQAGPFSPPAAAPFAIGAPPPQPGAPPSFGAQPVRQRAPTTPITPAPSPSVLQAIYGGGYAPPPPPNDPGTTRYPSGWTPNTGDTVMDVTSFAGGGSWPSAQFGTDAGGGGRFNSGSGFIPTVKENGAWPENSGWLAGALQEIFGGSGGGGGKSSDPLLVALGKIDKL